MIIQGNTDDIVIAIPRQVETAASIYATICDSTGVLLHWNKEHMQIKRGVLVLPIEDRYQTLNIPRGAVYIEVYARDEYGNLFWSRKIPEYVDNRYGNLGVGVQINDQTLHGDIVSYDTEYDAGNARLIIKDVTR